MKYKALNNFDYDGQSYKEGDEIELADEKLAKPLIGNGNIEAVKGKKDKSAEEPETKPEETKPEEEKDEGEDEGLEKLSFKELKELAKDKGIDTKGMKKKTDIVEAIKEAEEEPEE